MLDECGASVDHTTLYRWVQPYATEMEKRLRGYWRQPSGFCSWHLDETYIKVNDRWAYLYRAVSAHNPKNQQGTVRRRQISSAPLDGH
jgi:IS6 family transposase